MGRHWALLAGLLLFLTRTGAADPVKQLCQQRDAWCARKTFVWQATADNSLQISKQERAMLETRAMSGGIQIASRTWVHGRLAIMRRPGLTYVESVHDRCSHPWLNGRFGYWLGREFAVIAPANTPNVYSPPTRSCCLFPETRSIGILTRLLVMHLLQECTLHFLPAQTPSAPSRRSGCLSGAGQRGSRLEQWERWRYTGCPEFLPCTQKSP
jgi:hypothetical protein